MNGPPTAAEIFRASEPVDLVDHVAALTLLRLRGELVTAAVELLRARDREIASLRRQVRAARGRMD